jgi:hypothetical protein
MKTILCYWYRFVLCGLLPLIWVGCQPVDPAPVLNGWQAAAISPAVSATLLVQDANGQTREQYNTQDELSLVFRIYNAADTATIIAPLPDKNGLYSQYTFDRQFLTLSKVTASNPVEDVVAKASLTRVGDDITTNVLPARTIAEWRLPIRQPRSSFITWPVYIPANPNYKGQQYTQMSDPPPPLPPGLYRCAFRMTVQNVRPAFSITFQIR